MIFVEVSRIAEAEGFAACWLVIRAQRLVAARGRTACRCTAARCSRRAQRARRRLRVRSPINAAEAMRQARELIAPPAPVVDRSDAGWIEQLEVPALIVDVGNDKVRGVNQPSLSAVARRCRADPRAVRRALIGHLPPVRDEGMVQGRRIEAHNGDPRLVGLATVELWRQQWPSGLLTASQAESPLEMLAARTGLDTGRAAGTKRLIADYGLDFLRLCRAWRYRGRAAGHGPHSRAPRRALARGLADQSSIAGYWPARNSTPRRMQRCPAERAIFQAAALEQRSGSPALRRWPAPSVA